MILSDFWLILMIFQWFFNGFVGYEARLRHVKSIPVLFVFDPNLAGKTNKRKKKRLKNSNFKNFKSSYLFIVTVKNFNFYNLLILTKSYILEIDELN